MFAGAAYLPIDIHNPRERVEKILRDSGTRIILVQNQAYDQDTEWLHEWDCISVSELKTDSEYKAQENKAGDLAYVIYTSGTKWKIEDISPDERKNKLNEIRDRLVMKQYKVGEWPLFDLEISELEDVTILHISLDMLIADFLSINIIVDELEDNYFGDKKKTFTKELSFRDVIVYEHNRQKHPQYSETMKKDKQYWEERISTMPEAPDLPVKEDLKDTSIRQLNTYIEKERYLELQKLADDNNITLSGLILACYAEVLAYWSNSKRFSINVTMANREQVHPDIYSIIGDFTKINILEICQDYNLSFIQRVQFIQKQLWNDMEHMSYSGIEVLREMTRLKKKEVIIPYVFTSTLSMVSRKESTNHKGNLIYKISQTPQVLIDCQVMEYKEGILVNWDVREKAFPKKMIEMAFRTFSEMLIYTDTQNMLADKNVIKLPSDMKEIRKKKEVNYPYIPQLLHEGFCESVKKYPSKIALCSNGKEYTYKELGEYATSVKKELLRKNIKTADIVAIELKKGIWQIASVLGVLLAGGTYLPVDIGQPRNRKNKIELDAQAKFIITSNKNIDLLDCAEKIYVEDMVVADALEVEVLNTNTNQAAYIIYTSGTTGNPKGVVISHASAMNTINDVIRRYNITKNDSVLGISNLAFDLSVFDIFGIFAVGGKLVLPTDEKNVSEWGTLLLENQITIWNSVPAQMQMLLSYLEAEKKRKVEKLRLIMLSGDWIPVQLPKRMKQIFGNSRMISLGGATEASIWSIAYEINPDYVYEKSIPYGIPLSNQKFYILDDEMRECPDWVKGRIYISGKGLALGYFKDDSLTCRKFVFHKELEERLYDTGDMGRYRTDGVIEFLGREDYQVKIRGHRVELNEVESVINQCEDVEGSIVVTATENDDIIGAFVQPKIEKSVVDNTAEINDIKNKNKSFNQDSNLFEANVLDFADWLHASNETAIYDMLATFYKVEIFTDRNTWYPIKEIFNSLKVHSLLEKGINVIQEHPIDIDDYIMCIKIAQKNCCMYRLNTFYPQLSNVKQFIFLAGKLREKNDVQYINAECSVHVLFPLIDILGRAIGGLRPWKFERVEETYKNSPFCIIYGSIYNIPICINVQNQMDPSDPENSVLLFHKISLYTECGNLTMIGTNSDIMWEPRIRKYIAADGGFHLEADDEYLDLPVYEEMHNDEGKCFREMFSDTWPDSIKLFLEDFYRDFYLGKKMDSNAQFLISVCQAWKDLGNSIGSANIIHAYTTKPIKISEIVK